MGHQHRFVAVGYLEANAEIVAAHERAGLDQAAEADARARRDLFLKHVGRRVEEHDRVVERIEHEPGRKPEHAEARADQGQPPLLARHGSSRVISLPT